MEKRILMNTLDQHGAMNAATLDSAGRTWTAAICVGMALLLGACATSPTATPSAPLPARTTLPVAGTASPQTPASEPVASSTEERPVTLKPRSNMGLTPPTDVWERIRRGFAMPDLDNDFVRNREQWYSSRPDYMLRMTERSRPYLFHVVEELERRNMPTELALLPFIESAFNPQAVSSAKAAGMWQFMPATGKFFDL